MQENFEAEHSVASYSSTYEGVFSITKFEANLIVFFSLTKSLKGNWNIYLLYF